MAFQVLSRASVGLDASADMLLHLKVLEARTLEAKEKELEPLVMLSSSQTRLQASS
jgi:hypothetical protein